MQSGTTHGSLPGRLVFVLEGLRATGDDSKDPLSRMEQMISGLQFKVLRRELNYLRELETSICLAASEDENWK